MNIYINNMTLQDITILKPIFSNIFDDFWSINILEEDFKKDTSHYIVAKEETEIVGFAGVKVTLDEAELMNIVVKKDKRNLKIGSSLLEHILMLCKNLNCKSYLFLFLPTFFDNLNNISYIITYNWYIKHY